MALYRLYLLAYSRGARVAALGRAKFHLNRFTEVGTWEFPLFGKDSPHKGEPFNRFLQILRAFIRPAMLQKYFTLELICVTGYGVIAEKPRVGHLTRLFPCIL